MFESKQYKSNKRSRRFKFQLRLLLLLCGLFVFSPLVRAQAVHIRVNQTGYITQTLRYKKMTGDLRFHESLLARRDWLFGRDVGDYSTNEPATGRHGGRDFDDGDAQSCEFDGENKPAIPLSRRRNRARRRAAGAPINFIIASVN